jgi:hypothetical protein
MGEATSSGAVGDGLGLGDAEALGDGLGLGDALGVADALKSGRWPTDSTLASSADCQRWTPMTRRVPMMTAMLAQNTTRVDRDLVTT